MNWKGWWSSSRFAGRLRRAIANDRREARNQEPVTDRSQFLPVQARQVLQTRSPTRREVNLDTSLVVAACCASYPAGGLTSGHQRDDAMVLGLKALGQFNHGGPTSARVVLDLQHQLVLQWRHAVLVRHVFAEAQEPAQLVNERVPASRNRLSTSFDQAWRIPLAPVYITL